MSHVESFNNDGDARTKNIRHNATVHDLQGLTAIRDGKVYLLVCVVIDDRSLLHYACDTHRLRGTARAAPEFRHGHIVDGVSLRVGNDEVDYGTQDGKPA